jgi:hypothetical protein
MHDVLKERVWRRIQALPQEQIYQVLDYIEFLEAKYAKEKAHEPDVLQKFAERVEDSLRMRSVAPKVISGTVGLLGSARRVMRTVSDAGRDILGTQPAPGTRPPQDRVTTRPPQTGPELRPPGARSATPRPAEEDRRPPDETSTADTPRAGQPNQENLGTT